MYLSEKTGNMYPANEYVNHGYGGIKQSKKDLPHDEYPYKMLTQEDLDSGEYDLPIGGACDINNL